MNCLEVRTVEAIFILRGPFLKQSPTMCFCTVLSMGNGHRTGTFYTESLYLTFRINLDAKRGTVVTKIETVFPF